MCLIDCERKRAVPRKISKTHANRINYRIRRSQFQYQHKVLVACFYSADTEHYNQLNGDNT